MTCLPKLLDWESQSTSPPATMETSIRDVGAYTVSVPSNSPHATAVGGVSVFLNADYSIKFQTGWGTTITRIAKPGGTNAPEVPPVCASTLAPGQCFYFGGGGGMSQFFAKPSYQSGLPGTGRQQPDVSLTADPYTGVTIISSYSSPGTFSVGVIGGTSASVPDVLRRVGDREPEECRSTPAIPLVWRRRTCTACLTARCWTWFRLRRIRRPTWPATSSPVDLQRMSLPPRSPVRMCRPSSPAPSTRAHPRAGTGSALDWTAPWLRVLAGTTSPEWAHPTAPASSTPSCRNFGAG